MLIPKRITLFVSVHQRQRLLGFWYTVPFAFWVFLLLLFLLLFKWMNSAPGTILCILPSPLHSAHKVYFLKTRLMGGQGATMFTAAPYNIFLRLGKWHRRSEYALIALLTISEVAAWETQELLQLNAFNKQMCAFGGMMQPERSICFTYCLFMFLSWQVQNTV